MRSKWIRRLGIAAITGLVGWASVGCAQERDPINQVQADALDKHFFVGASLSDNTDDPEFYMRNTIVDVPDGDSNGLFTAYYSQPLARIKWEIQEDNLIARLTYQQIANSDGHGSQTTNNGQIVGMWTITSQFDIRRSYNPQTGEELNLITENSTDRPWYERDYFRVDWSKNLITDGYSLDSLSGAGLQGVKFDPEAYYVQDPSDPNAPTFDQDNGYFDVTTKALATPQIIDTPYGNYPACFFTETIPTLNCNATEVTLRLSFKKVVDTDYEPEDWDGTKMDAFGWFTEDRIGYDRNYGVLDDNWHRFAARYNIWNQSHIQGSECAIDYWRDANNNIINYKVNGDGSFATDANGLPIPDANGQPHPGTPIGSDVHRDLNNNGTEDECEFLSNPSDPTSITQPGSQCDEFTNKCDLPLYNRQTKTIPWYFGADGAPDLFASTARALNEWNVAVLRAALIGQNVEATRVGGSSPVPQTFDLSTEDALIADQAPGVVKPVFHPIFTLCHNPSITTDDPTCFKHDSAGNMLKDANGNPIMVTARLGDIRYNFVDMVPTPMNDSPWGIMVDANDPLTGEKVTTSVNEWASVLDVASQGTEDLLRWINGEISDTQITSGSYLRDWVNASKLGTGAYQPDTLTHDQIINAPKSITNAGLTTTVNGKVGAYTSRMSPAGFLAAQSQNLAKTMGGSIDSRFEASRQALIGSPAELKMITPMDIQRAGYNPNATPLAGNPSTIAAVSPLQAMNPQVKMWIQRLKDQNSAYMSTCQIEQPEPDALVGMARQAQRLYPLPQDAAKGSPGYAAVGDPNYAPLKAQRDQALHQWIREQFNVSVIAHEMGHSMGLRHNFTGSWDSLNYKPQYWQLRTENGKEKACSDITQPHVDGHDCVGPRWIDPVTDEETNGLIWKWGSSTVMDYPGDQTQDMNDIGLYDKAAMRFGYVDIVDVDKTIRSGPEKTLYDGRFDGFGGISGPFDITAFAQSGPSSAHYSQFNDMYNLLGTCGPQTDPTDLLSSHCDGVALDFTARRDMIDGHDAIYSDAPLIHWEHNSKNQIRHPYMFGSDEFADFGNMPVFRFDSGADAYEQAQFISSTYENRYIFVNFRRDRTTFNTDATVSRIQTRYFDKLTTATKALGLYLTELGTQAGSFTDPVQGAGLLFPHTLASAISMNEFIKVFTRPEPGVYNSTDPNGVAIIDGTSQNAGMVSIPVGSGDGRYINNDYDYSQGYWWSSYQTQVGSFYEKEISIYYLTEAYNNFVQNSRNQYVDGRYLNINYATLYPDQMRRFFSGIMQNDLSAFAPYVQVQAQGNSATVPTASVQYLPWQGTAQLNYPAGAMPIDPVIGWEEQYPALIFGFVFGGTTLTEDWVDEMRVFSPTGGDTVSIPANQQIVYDDPISGMQYVARDYGTETVNTKNVQRTSGARMLAYVGALAKATYVNTPDPTLTGHTVYTLDANKQPTCAVDAGTCAANAQTIRTYASNLDSLRQLVTTFGNGNLNWGAGGGN